MDDRSQPRKRTDHEKKCQASRSYGSKCCSQDDGKLKPCMIYKTGNLSLRSMANPQISSDFLASHHETVSLLPGSRSAYKIAIPSSNFFLTLPAALLITLVEIRWRGWRYLDISASVSCSPYSSCSTDTSCYRPISVCWTSQTTTPAKRAARLFTSSLLNISTCSLTARDSSSAQSICG